MANPTMTLIASNTVGSGGAASVTFSSIPATYTDLVIKVSARTNRSYFLDQLKMSFNGIASGYSYKDLDANPSGPYSGGSSSASVIYTGFTSTTNNVANTFGSVDIYIPNYTSSNPKSTSADSVSEDNATSAGQNMVAGFWSYSGNPAISSINLTMDVGTLFTQYSTFYLYGINNS